MATASFISKVAESRESRAAWCELVAAAHAGTDYAVEMEAEAAEWRAAAQLARSGNVQPVAF